MRTIIAGSRTLTQNGLVESAVKASGFVITEVYCGEADGIDKAGKRWAQQQGIPVRSFPANWQEHGKAAGPLRNREMIATAEALIAVWDGVSRGTEDCISEARRRGLKVFVFVIGER